MQVLIIFLITAQIYRKSSIKKSVIFAQNWTWNRSWRYSQEPKIWNEHGNFFNEYVNDSFRVSHFSVPCTMIQVWRRLSRVKVAGRAGSIRRSEWMKVDALVPNWMVQKDLQLIARRIGGLLFTQTAKRAKLRNIFGNICTVFLNLLGWKCTLSRTKLEGLHKWKWMSQKPSGSNDSFLQPNYKLMVIYDTCILTSLPTRVLKIPKFQNFEFFCKFQTTRKFFESSVLALDAIVPNQSDRVLIKINIIGLRNFPK